MAERNMAICQLESEQALMPAPPSEKRIAVIAISSLAMPGFVLVIDGPGCPGHRAQREDRLLSSITATTSVPMVNAWRNVPSTPTSAPWAGAPPVLATT